MHFNNAPSVAQRDSDEYAALLDRNAMIEPRKSSALACLRGASTGGVDPAALEESSWLSAEGAAGLRAASGCTQQKHAAPEVSPRNLASKPGSASEPRPAAKQELVISAAALSGDGCAVRAFG
jgi:hypothetical protein